MSGKVRADLYATLDDRAAERRAREESLALWKVVAALPDVPSDVTEEAEAALAQGGR